tara:strand:+ start:6816 stop:7739 length:924 start_codon:yes stop_codon:yes gene_type:complete
MINEDLRKIHQYITKIKNVLFQSHEIKQIQPISPDTLTWLLNQSRVVLMRDPVLIKTHCPIHICGDIHGQFECLLKIFNLKGYPSQHNRYLFLGDYVDRGKQSIEVFCLLLCYKLLFPNDIFLLRGNHETESVSRMYGFYDECKRRYSIKMYRSFVDVFNCLPIAAVLGMKNQSPLAFCCHGGLSPNLQYYNAIQYIKRPTDVPDEGIICDLLWSDPDTEENRKGWNESERGVSYVFGKDVIKKFLKDNNLELIIRAHQVVEDGYEFYANRDLVTVFSASNYCGEFDNLGGIISLDENLLCGVTVFK